MKSIKVGQSGLYASELGLGTINFGTELDESASFAIMDRAAELGITHIDTADVYPSPESPEIWGLTEEIVGRWLKGRRDDFVVATKAVNRVGPGANDAGGSRKHLLAACERSLRRLGTDYVDIFYLHRPDMLDAPLEETLGAVDKIVQDGKALYIGLSNFSTWQVALVLEAIAASRLAPVTVLQDRYNLVSRRNERDLYPLAAAKGLGLFAYNPLAAGMLAGLFKRGAALPGEGRFTTSIYQDRYFREDVYDAIDVAQATADELGVPVAQLALAWILQQGFGVSPIVGALRPEHLSDSVKALDLVLPPEVMERLNGASTRFS
ncbi:MAG TPA: aldo/keto reductase [Trebonia sp.]|jgi:aryl-alcohol dehydrogenase-like predicted oxidoreductase|nr:aldo/keto reductase [Trebonia sp.]